MRAPGMLLLACRRACEPVTARFLARCMAFGVPAYVLAGSAGDRSRKRRGSQNPSLVAFLFSRPEDPDERVLTRRTHQRATVIPARPERGGGRVAVLFGSIGPCSPRHVHLEDGRELIEESCPRKLFQMTRLQHVVQHAFCRTSGAPSEDT